MAFGHKYAPTEADRNTVVSMAACGFNEEHIATCVGRVGITAKTLRRHFKRELDISHLQAEAAIGNVLYQRAIAGEAWAVTMFLKTRRGGRWREPIAHQFVDSEGNDRPFMLADADALIRAADAEEKAATAEAATAAAAKAAASQPVQP